MAIGQVRQVVITVADVGQAVEWFQRALGLPLQFQDGDRWAAFSLGEVTLALASEREVPEGGPIHLGIKVEDADAGLAALANGGRVVEAPRDGAHERRAAGVDAHGVPFLVYSPREASSSGTRSGAGDES